MSQGADIADQMVQEGIQVSESAVKLAGLGVKNLAILVLKLLQDNRKLKGKTGLNDLLRSNKPLITFAIDKTNLAAFRDKAEDYGVLFSSVHHTGNDNQCDIMVKADDAAMVHRIFETIHQPIQPVRQETAGRSTQNWFQQTAERLTDPARRLEGKTGPLEGLGAETLAALVYQLAAENRQHIEASPLSYIFEEGKSLQITEIPEHCRRDILEQADVLGVPLHFQASETPGMTAMMAKSEDAAVINRLFENMGIPTPMRESREQGGQSASHQREVTVPIPAEPVHNGADDGRSSVKAALAMAMEKSQSGKPAVAQAHITAKAATR